MRIEGHKPGPAQDKIVLKRGDGVKPITFLATALPMGFVESVEADIPSPVARLVGFKKVVGGGILLGPDKKPIEETEENTPAFKAKIDAVNRMHTTLWIVKGLGNDPNVVFDTNRDQCNSVKEYAEKINKEIAEFGLSGGDFNYVVNEILRISNPSQKKREAVRDDFLSEAD